MAAPAAATAVARRDRTCAPRKPGAKKSRPSRCRGLPASRFSASSADGPIINFGRSSGRPGAGQRRRKRSRCPVRGFGDRHRARATAHQRQCGGAPQRVLAGCVRSRGYRHAETRAPGAWQRRQRGLSIVELMVGVAIGLFVVAAASMLVVTQLSDNRRLTLETQVQQDLRATADIITRELRRAGHWGKARDGVWYRGQCGGRSRQPLCRRRQGGRQRVRRRRRRRRRCC